MTFASNDESNESTSAHYKCWTSKVEDGSSLKIEKCRSDMVESLVTVSAQVLKS